MPATYDAIASSTLGAATSTITFSSISSGFTDLKLVTSYTTATSGQLAMVRYNNDSGSNYYGTFITGNGSTASGAMPGAYTAMYLPNYGNNDGTTPTTGIVELFSYANSKKKMSLTTVANDKNTSGITQIERSVCLWDSTAAVNRIDIICTSGNFNIGSQFTLYGILKA